jgi:hypothetical protein
VKNPPQVAKLFWTQRQDIGPSPRFGHALAHDARARRTLLFGGNASGPPLRDTWHWDGEAWTQIDDMGPSARSGHALAYDSARSRVVLFGGAGAAGPLADTWEWDGAGWTQVEDSGPGARAGHALAHDSARSRVVLFGGGVDARGFADTWEWDGTAWTQVADQGPSARMGHCACFDAQAGRTVVFGGAPEPDTWAWDGETWTQIADTGPPPAGNAALVSSGAGAFLFGGVGSGKPFGSTWALSGAAWTERQNMGPPPRWGHAMAYEPGRERIVLFGGMTGTLSSMTAAHLLGDTWELPVAAPPGVQGPLLDFIVDPPTVGAGSRVVLTVHVTASLVPVEVLVTSDPPPFGVIPWHLMVPAGETTAAMNLDSGKFAPGAYTLTAKLGASELSRPLARI